MRKNLTDGNLALTGYSDIFKPTSNLYSITSGESIVEIPLEELHPPEFHPFNVLDDESMIRLSENIKRYGVREPGLARPLVNGTGMSCERYELVCGNRRKRASELAGLSTMPVIIRALDDDSAALAMVDSNLEQREKILPSERAWAYKVMMEALNHSGVKGESQSYEIMEERTGIKKSQLYRLMRLTELIHTLLDKVDAKQLAFNPAVELSYLSLIEQTAVASAMEKYEVKPSLSQSQRLKKIAQAGELTVEMIGYIISENNKPPKGEPAGSMRFRKFFPPQYSQKDMDNVITSLLKTWQAEQARNAETNEPEA